VYYLLRADRESDQAQENLALSGLFAALSSQAREYGPAYGLVAFLWLLGKPKLRGHIGYFALTLITVGLPWYFRNALLTGNPVWSNAVAGLPANSVHSLLMACYGHAFAISTWNTTAWFRVLAWSAFGAPLAVLGFWGCLRSAKRYALLVLTSAASFALFLLAVGSTSSDPTFAFRVYGPALALLCIPAAGVIEPFLNRKGSGPILKAVIVLLAARTLCDSYLFPRSLYVISAVALRGQPKLEPDDSKAFDLYADSMAAQIEGKGVLVTDDAGLASRLAALGHRVWAVWDPRVIFTFDSTVSPEQSRARLLALGVTDISVSRDAINRDFLEQWPFWASIESQLDRLPPKVPLQLAHIILADERPIPIQAKRL